MKQPNVINLLTDYRIAIDGNSVIRDSDQTIIEAPILTLNVNIFLVDLTRNSASHGGISTTPATFVMTRHTVNYCSSTLNVGWWTINMSDLIAAFNNSGVFLETGRKYVGTVSDAGNATIFRTFKLEEFAIDNEMLDSILAKLPYIIEIGVGGADSYMKWYDSIDPNTTLRYQAKLYEGGSGTTPATRVDRVTHRGPVLTVS